MPSSTSVDTLLKDQVSYGLLWPPVRYLAEDDLKFSILLPQPSRCWVTDMSHCAWLYEVLGIKPWVSCSLGINPTCWATSLALHRDICKKGFRAGELPQWINMLAAQASNLSRIP